jgi:glyoxylase I family protein
MQLSGIYHININCTNFERSLAFYKRLGFTEVVDFGNGGDLVLANASGLKLPSPARGRARLLQLRDDPRACPIDLIEWLEPKSEGRPYEWLNHTGVVRVCLSSKKFWQDYEELKAYGVTFYATPGVLTYPRGQSLAVCFEDPDGTVLQLLQFQKTAPVENAAG